MHASRANHAQCTPHAAAYMLRLGSQKLECAQQHHDAPARSGCVTDELHNSHHPDTSKTAHSGDRVGEAAVQSQQLPPEEHATRMRSGKGAQTAEQPASAAWHQLQALAAESKWHAVSDQLQEHAAESGQSPQAVCEMAGGASGTQLYAQMQQVLACYAQLQESLAEAEPEGYTRLSDAPLQVRFQVRACCLACLLCALQAVAV